MLTRSVRFGDGSVNRIRHGADLLEELTRLCVEHDITLGRVEAIGAVQKARIGFYNQSTREYEFRELDHPLEILALVGNVSLKDGRPIVHAHITLADHEGHAFGGHLAPGCVVFACECVIQRIDGDALERAFDDETGLPLWEE
jgi:hypothetical protein